MNDRKPMQLRLPRDLKDWIEAQAAKNGASQNSEIIRAIRDRMENTGNTQMQHADYVPDNFPENCMDDSPAPRMR